jgi:lycopene cyclase domain-containing protein
MSYTALSVVGVAGALLLDLVVLGTRLVRRRSFWTAYGIVLVFQLLTNGWLTGRDIVTYDEGTILGARLAFRSGGGPVVRVLAGAADLSWWEWWGRRAVPAGP